MSILGGIYLFGGEKVSAEMLCLLGSRLASRGPDGGRDLVRGRIGVSYRAFHTNRESRFEDQPAVTREGLILAWDGRLDNRVELIGVLKHYIDDGLSSITDVQLVAAAYRKWGVKFPTRLIGDFAFSLWDESRRRLLLVRDPVGTRPLYYLVGSERVLWCSDLTALTDVSGLGLELDEDYVAGFLSFGKDVSRTPFVDVKAVRPGFVVSIEDLGIVQERRFWGLCPDAEIRLENDGEYEERFVELFEESVRSRLRSDSTVMAELSGGLDSSSIVCMAHRLLMGGSAETPKIEMVSHVSDESKTADERRFIRHVEEHVGYNSNYIREEDYPFFTPLPNTTPVSTINPYLTNAGHLMGMNALMVEKRARVALSGLGGDELLHSVNDPTPELSDLLVSRRFIELFRRVGMWANVLREPYGRLMWRRAILPNLPISVRAKLQRDDYSRIPVWLNREFVKRTRLRERVVGLVDVFGFRRPSGRDQSIGFSSVSGVISLGHLPEICQYEISYPFLHRPLVEFLCAIPFEQLLRPRDSRSLMRRALVGVLPEATRRRRGKGNPQEMIMRAFDRQWFQYSELFEKPLVARYGFVEAELLREAFTRARHGVDTEGGMLASALTLEVWLRRFEARRRSAVGAGMANREWERSPVCL